MASQYCSRLHLSCLIMLVALQCSNAKVYEGRERKGKSESETGIQLQVYLQTDTNKFVWGRKMLQGLDEKLDFPGAHEMLKEKRNEKSEVDKNVVSKHDNYYMSESKAGDDVAKLMSKDYKGQGRPNRKPPINNREPED